MARYLKKHRLHIAGFAVPVFFLFIIGFLSFSIFPGWLKPTYGVPGAACSQPTSFQAPFSPDCDICNGELCLPNSANSSQLQCAAIQGSIIDFITSNTSAILTPDFSSGAQAPQCPNGYLAAIFRIELGGVDTSTTTNPLDLPGLIYPACYDQCVTSTFTTMSSTTTLSTAAGASTVTILLPVCQPSTTFCQGISGGDGSNECRTGECVAQATPDAAGNPTGCEYEYVDAAQNEDCQLCTDATEAGIPACGNGVCEVDEGENCSSCAVDCLLPGFEDSCPLTSGGAIADACNPIPSPSVAPIVVVAAITLPDGPPLDNLRGSLSCEDGDLCTDNACSADGSTCESTPKLASGDTPDFCCPAGAAFPDSGTCGDLLGSNCDVDCYVPTECSANLTELSGTGCGSSLTGLDASSAVSGVWGLFSLIALALPVALRKRS